MVCHAGLLTWKEAGAARWLGHEGANNCESEGSHVHSLGKGLCPAEGERVACHPRPTCDLRGGL